MLPLGHPAPQFDDSFPEKLLKIVATCYQRRDFQPEIHQIPFGGQAPPGPARGAKALPRPIPVTREPTSKGREGNGRGIIGG